MQLSADVLVPVDRLSSLLRNFRATDRFCEQIMKERRCRLLLNPTRRARSEKPAQVNHPTRIARAPKLSAMPSQQRGRAANAARCFRRSTSKQERRLCGAGRQPVVLTLDKE